MAGDEEITMARGKIGPGANDAHFDYKFGNFVLLKKACWWTKSVGSRKPEG